MAPGLLEEEPEGTVVLAVSAYGSGRLRSDLEGAGFEPVIKPLPLRAAVDGGFTLDDFEIDEAASIIGASEINERGGRLSRLLISTVS